jgi:antitoxin (DNA-binding transcriptional repressor) of toxin-antitoxin stability system
MKQVSITDLKNKLSEYLRLVKRGETVEILERDVPIARIEKVKPARVSRDAYLKEMERRGILEPPLEEPDPDLLKNRPPTPCSVDVVRVLIEQRGGL